MKILFLVATFLLPICASAACNIPAGPLELPKTGIKNGIVLIGCINDSLEFVSPEAGSTYSWVSMGRIDVRTSAADKSSVRVASKIVLAKNWWVSISSSGNRIIDRGWMPHINGKYAKIENGVVTDVTVISRNYKFPSNGIWILISHPRQVAGDEIEPGYRYKNGQFFPPNDSPDGTRK